MPAVMRLGGLLLAVPLVSLWRHDAIPLQVPLLATALVALTLWRPRVGLLLLAGLLPLSTLLTGWLFPAGGAAWSGTETAEILVLSVLAPACCRSAAGPRGALERPLLAFAAIVAASAATLVAVQQLTVPGARTFASLLVQHVFGAYFLDPQSNVVMHTAAVLLEAVALAIVIPRAWAGAPAPVRAVAGAAVIGAAAAGSWSLVRLAQVGSRADRPFDRLVELVQSIRLHPHYGDVNAGASFYALMIVPAVALAVEAGRRPSRGTAARVLSVVAWLAAAGFIGVALWLTGSRAGHVGAAVGLVLFGVLGGRLFAIRTGKLAWGLVAVVGLALAVELSTSRTRASVRDAFEVRQEMAATALRVTKTDPMFGVGVGQFRRESRAHASPRLVALFPPAGRGENAHNIFLQVLGEYGVIGLAAFVWILANASRAAARAWRDGAGSFLLAGSAGGLAAYLVSALSGHPILVPEATWPFFLILGLLAALSRPATAPVEPRSRPWILILLVAVLAATLPWRMAEARRRTDLGQFAIGADAEIRELDGMSYRRASARSSWFVSTSARTIAVPLRLAASSRTPCRIAVSLDALPADQVDVTADAWREVTFTFAAPPRGTASRRIDLTHDPPDCQLLVGRIERRR